MTTDNIETERLIIKSTKEEDGILCLDIWLDDEMSKYLSDPPRAKANEDTLDFSKDIENQEGWYPFTAVSKKSFEFIGTCSIAPNKDCTHWDLGYCVHKNYWRQGYATEMIKALIDFGYRNGCTVFTANVAQENIGSNIIMQKLGFKVEKTGSFKKACTDIEYASYTYKLELE